VSSAATLRLAGPLIKRRNASIHKIDVCVDAASLEVLKDVYRGTLERLVA
jgi:hypothetical protein